MSPQTNRFPRFRPSAAILAAALAAAVLPGAARADTFEATVTHLTSPYIEVLSNGSSYHQTSPFANLVADARFQVDVGVFGRVKSWKGYLGLKGKDSGILWFQTYGKSKSYPWYDRPRTVDRTEHLIVPEVAWSGYVKARCNELADNLRGQGLGNTAIFSKDRKIKLAVPVDMEVDTTGAGSNSIFTEATPWESMAKIDLICKKWPGAAVPQASTNLTTEPAKVVNNGLSILERSALNGVCKIRLDGWITTDQKGATVKFRYRNQEGKQSQVWTVNTGDSKTATFSHWYDIPNTDWAETGSVRMVGVSHDFKSAWASYSMNCVEGGPGNLAVAQPPKLNMVFVEQGKVMVHGQICPEKLKLVGKLEGRSSVSGYAAFVAKSGPTYISPPQAYSITDGQVVLLGADYPIDWSNVMMPSPGDPVRYGPSFDFNVTDSNDKIIASIKNRQHMMFCKRPAVNPVVGGGARGLTVEPREPAAPASPAAPKVLRRLPAPSAGTQLRVVPRIVSPRPAN